MYPNHNPNKNLTGFYNGTSSFNARLYVLYCGHIVECPVVYGNLLQTEDQSNDFCTTQRCKVLRFLLSIFLHNFYTLEAYMLLLLAECSWLLCLVKLKEDLF